MFKNFTLWKAIFVFLMVALALTGFAIYITPDGENTEDYFRIVIVLIVVFSLSFWLWLGCLVIKALKRMAGE